MPRLGNVPTSRAEEVPAMVVSWHTTDDRIWFGTWRDNDAPAPSLHLVTECLPNSKRWDWAVWQSDEPMILRRGIAPSALDAAAAAEAAAARWREAENKVPRA